MAAPREYSSGSGPSARARFLGVRLSAGRIGQTLVFFIFNIQKRSLLSASLTEIVHPSQLPREFHVLWMASLTQWT